MECRKLDSLIFLNVRLNILLKVWYNIFNMINTVSITDLKQNTADVVKKVRISGKPIIVMQRSEPAAILVDPDHYQILEKALEDLEDLRDIELRKNDPTVPMDEVMEKLASRVSSKK